MNAIVPVSQPTNKALVVGSRLPVPAGRKVLDLRPQPHQIINVNLLPNGRRIRLQTEQTVVIEEIGDEL